LGQDREKPHLVMLTGGNGVTGGFFFGGNAQRYKKKQKKKTPKSLCWSLHPPPVQIGLK
jgi:hypothetical protein